MAVGAWPLRPFRFYLVGCEVAVPPFLSLPTSTVRGFYYCSSSAFCFCCP